jgi:hypothetical protein
MSRHFFSGAPIWAFAYDGTNVIMVAGATITAWDSPTNGTQITDLLAADGTTAIDHISSADGTGDDALGQCPAFYGPDNVTNLWLSANGGPRVLASATDLSDDVTDNGIQLMVTNGSLVALTNSFGAPGGVGTLDEDGLLTAAQRPDFPAATTDCTDTSVVAVANGDTFLYKSSTSKWTNIHAPAWNSLTWTSGLQSHKHAVPAEANASDPRWRFDPETRRVFLRGAVERTAGGDLIPSGNFLVVATLPSQARPAVATNCEVGAQLTSGQGYCRLDIGTDGTLTLTMSSGYRPDWASIDCDFFLD